MSIRHAIRSVLIIGLLVASTPAPADAELYEACANADGLPVVTVAEGVSVDVDTPIGATGTGKVQSVDGGDYLIDLAGEEVGTTKTINVDLSWTNGVVDDLSDYDMFVDGTKYDSTSNPESASIDAAHCQVISVDEIYTYTGTPLDALTLDVSVSPWSF